MAHKYNFKILYPLIIIVALFFYEENYSADINKSIYQYNYSLSDSVNASVSVANKIDTFRLKRDISEIVAEKIAELETDTISITMPDSLKADILEIDAHQEISQAYQDSIVIIEGSKISPISGYIRPDTQRPLPAGTRLSIIESSDLGGEYYFAIIREMVNEYFENHDLYAVADGRIKSSAFVISKPALESLVDYRTRNVFNSTYEAEQFADTLKARFEISVEVVLNLRSYDINMLDVNRSDLFDINLISNNNVVEPIDVTTLHINNRVVDQISWYERRIILKFPRRYEGVDIWNTPSIVLELIPKFEGLDLEGLEKISFNLVP